MNTIHLFSVLLPEVMRPLLGTWWFQLSVSCCILLIGFIFYWMKVKSFRHQKAELQCVVIERSELLAYAIERERKALETITTVNRAKSLLLTRINHEIRTPMNGVIGMAALLAETQLTSEQREYNETIRTCGENLLTVINDILLSDILAYSKIESDKLELNHKDFDLRNSIEEVLDVFSGKVAANDVELLYQINNDVPLQLLGDSQRFRQILMNLVENAVRFTKKGEILLKVQLANKEDVKTEANGVALSFEISDTGVGIAAGKLKALVKNLSLANGSVIAQTGMGLVICKKLISSMGGDLKIKSQENIGTKVSFTLQTKVSLTPARTSILQDMSGLEGRKILIVDDNQTTRNILKNELEQWRLLPIAVGSGKQALEMLAQPNHFDLVLTDMQMPEMNGVELATVIHEKHPALSVILLSKEGDDTGKQHPDLFSSVVTKPIRQDMLNKHVVTKLRHLTNKNGTPQEQNLNHKLSVEFSQQYPLRILIAEDNRVNQKLAMRVLSKLGYNPDIAEDGKEVLEMVSQTKYDLILMDVQMPEMDGLEATRMIRLCLEVQPVIIAMTANSMQGDREECLRAGMDDYISKPVHLEELVIILEKWALQVKDRV